MLLAVLLILAGCLLYISYNPYIKRALWYKTPDIDDYRIFYNRPVKAGNPQPWRFAPDYNQKAIPEARLPYFKELGTVAFLVVRDTAIVFEEYWEGYSENSHSNSFSAAKSIVALLAGIARDEGKIISFDQPVADFYPPYASDRRKEITWKDLLTMSAGLEWDEAYASLFSITTKAYYGDDLEKLMKNVPAEETPGRRYRYQSGVTQVLSFAIANAVGKSISEYASEKLWTPIGAEQDALWSLDHKNGLEKAYCCFNSNARDFARIGQLVLNKGRWNGRQVVSETFLSEALTPASWLKAGDTERPVDFYGYQWWRLPYKGMAVNYARGINGQYIFVIPEKNAVVVRLGHHWSKTRTPDNLPEDIYVWLDTAMDLLGE